MAANQHSGCLHCDQVYQEIVDFPEIKKPEDESEAKDDKDDNEKKDEKPKEIPGIVISKNKRKNK